MANERFGPLVSTLLDAHHAHEDARRRGVSSDVSAYRRKNAADALLAAIAELEQERDASLDDFAKWYQLQKLSNNILPNMGMQFLVQSYRLDCRDSTDPTWR